jgi:hypothetical protein
MQENECRGVGVLRSSSVENIQSWDAGRCIVASRSDRARPTRLASVEPLGSPSWGGLILDQRSALRTPHRVIGAEVGGPVKVWVPCQRVIGTCS